MKALQVVSAWAGQTGLTLGQVAGDTQANEITALPALLERWDLPDKSVTIAAIGGQTELAQALGEGGGGYVVAVKGKHPRLHAEVPAAFAQAPAPPLRSLRRPTTGAKGHGRSAQRTGEGVPAREYLSAAQIMLWVGGVSRVRVTRVVWESAPEGPRTQVRSLLRSLPPVARRLGSAMRGQWRSEKGLHWVVEGGFRQAARRVYERTTAEKVAFMNRLALSLLRGDPRKSALKVKRKRAGWSISYLRQLLGFPST